MMDPREFAQYPRTDQVTEGEQIAFQLSRIASALERLAEKLDTLDLSIEPSGIMGMLFGGKGKE